MKSLSKEDRDHKDKKILIAYHAHCLDGFSAAWAAHRGLTTRFGVQPEAITLLPVQYGKLAEFEREAILNDIIYVVDFSIEIPLIATLQSRDIQVTIIDHHKTAKELYGDATELYGAKIVLDMEESGATLTWKYFMPVAPVPMLLKYVKDYDLWQFSFSDTKVINRFLRVQEQSLTHWSFLAQDFMYTCSIADARSQGEAIEAYHTSIVEDLVEGAEETELAGEKGLAVNCSPQFASDVGHLLAVKSGTFGATWQQVQGDVKISLRSNGDYDVSALAAKFGGGGHRNAAGFTLSAPQEGSLFPDSEAKTGVKVWGIPS